MEILPSHRRNIGIQGNRIAGEFGSWSSSSPDEKSETSEIPPLIRTTSDCITPVTGCKHFLAVLEAD